MKVYNPQAEKLLLCALLERPKLRQYAISKLHEDLFGSESMHEIYVRMIFLQEQGKKVPSAAVMVNDPGLSLEAQTALTLTTRERAKLASFRPSDIDHCLDQVKYYYRVRVLYEMNKWVAEQFEGNAQVDMDEVKAELQQRILTMDVFDEIAENLQIIGQGANITDKYLEDHLSRKKMRTVPTGYSVIDDRAKWNRGNMVLLTAKRGQGKSLLAKSLGLSHFRQGQNVLTVNLEMEKWEYLCRLFAQETPFSHDQLREGLATPWQIKKAIGAKKRLDRDGMKFRYPNPDYNSRDPNNKHEWIDKPCRWALRTINRPDYTPAQLHNELRHQGYDVVIIDYINLFKQGNKDLWASLYEHTKYLKMMAKDLGILLYILAQLTDEGRAKYARAAEEDSDAWLYWEINRGSPSVKMFHGKARHYKPYSFPLVFRHYNMQFAEEIDVGLVCSNKDCRSTFPKADSPKDEGFEEAEPKVSKDLLDELAGKISKQDKSSEDAEKSPEQQDKAALRATELRIRLKVLKATCCPDCRYKKKDAEKHTSYKLVDEMKLLENLASEDAEEHQKHVDEVAADRKQENIQARKDRHDKKLKGQAERMEGDDSK